MGGMNAQELGNRPDDVVGHKTFRDGDSFRHEPLMRAEAEAMVAAMDAHENAMTELMPDEDSAIRMMFNAYQRLRALGWKDAVYAPKDGTEFLAIERSSTGKFPTRYIMDGKYLDNDVSERYFAMFRPIDAREAQEAGDGILR